MSQTHWKKLGDPNFLGGYDFEDGERKTLTIRTVENKEAFNPGDKKTETVRACTFVEKVKPMILNSTNSKMLSSLYKSDYVENWVGRQFVVHFDKTIKVGREVVGGLRILNMQVQAANGEVSKCFDCKGKIEGIEKMNASQMAAYTSKKYGKPLCAECATRLSQAPKVEDILPNIKTGVATDENN